MATPGAGGVSLPGRSRPKFTPRAAVLAVVLIALLMYMAVPLRQYLDQRSRLAHLERQTELLQKQDTQLQRRVRQLHDPDYVERLARECLGMVRPGEIAFIVIPKGQPPHPPAC